MQLPCLSTTYDELMAVLGTASCTAADVAEVVGNDVVLTAKVMQLVNSGFFGSARRVDNMVEAIHCLGMDVVRALVATIEAFDGFKTTVDEVQIRAVFHHCLRVSELARSIAAFEGFSIADQGDALLAGMLHDIGKLVLARAYPDRYAHVLLDDGHGWPDWQLEHGTTGASQSEVGGYLLGLWGFQIHIVEAVAFHDRPGACNCPVFSLTTIIHAANALAKTSEDVGENWPQLDREYLARVDKLSHVRAWANLREEAWRVA
jgi:HD-like signal output (HDOD) protein